MVQQVLFTDTRVPRGGFNTLRGPKTPQHTVKNLGAPGPQHFASSQNSSTLCHQPSVSLSSTLCDLWGAQQFASSWGSTLCEHRGLLTKTRRDGVHKNEQNAALRGVTSHDHGAAADEVRPDRLLRCASLCLAVFARAGRELCGQDCQSAVGGWHDDEFV